MSDKPHRESVTAIAPVVDLVQRGTDRFHDQQAEARRAAAGHAPERANAGS